MMEQKIDKGIGWLQKLLNLQRRYGFFSILKGLFLILLAGYVIFFALNPKYLLEKMDNIQKENHSDAIAQRLRSDSEVRLILDKLLLRSGADRSYLIEFHNGSKNLATDLPFLFGSMRLESTTDSIAGVEDEYADFSLSRYPLMVNILKDGFFYGSVEKVKPLDKKLYFKLKSNNVNEIALIALYQGDNPLGILGLSYCNSNKMQCQAVGLQIRKAAMKISPLLSPNL
jgi:hypothetical protein